MEYRSLGKSGLQVPVLSFGTMTFGGSSGFEAIGHTQVEEARKLVDICLEAGVNMFNTADMYSLGAVGWNISPQELQQLNEVSAIRETYPTWHQRRFAHERNPQLG